MQDHPDVKHPVLAHLPIHVLNVLSICDKNKSWAASLRASLDRIMHTSAASGFLIGCYSFVVNPEASVPSEGIQELPRAPGKMENNQETPGSLTCQGSLHITWSLEGGLPYTAPFCTQCYLI